MDKEKLIKQIIKECEADGEPVTREEAEEMAEMEIKAKKDCKRYETAEKPPQSKKSAPREKKIDAEKVEIIKSIAKNINRCVFDDDREVANIKIANEQKEITFTVGANEYSITLTRHRKK